MKFILYVFVFYFLFSCRNQDSFQRYSYLTTSKLSGDTVFSSTGFFLKYQNRVYLISAWHSFSGFWADSNIQIKEGFVPKEIRIVRCKENQPREMKNFSLFSSNRVIYLEPHRSGVHYDIAALPMATTYKPDNVLDFDEFKADSVLANDEIFYWGYPVHGMQVDTLPSIMEGSISSITSEHMPHHYEGAIYSTHGCSGSPVFKKAHNNFYLIGLISGGNIDRTFITPLGEALKSLNFR